MNRVSMPTGRNHGMAKSNVAIIVVSVALVFAHIACHIAGHESIHVSAAGWVAVHALRKWHSDRIHSTRSDWFGADSISVARVPTLYA